MPEPSDPHPSELAAPRRRSGRLIVVGILATCVLAVLLIVVFRSATGPDPIAARVPADARIFLQVTLQPSLSQKRAIGALADRLPGGRDAAGDEVRALLGSRIIPGFDLGAMRFDSWAGDQLALASWMGPDGEIVCFVAHAADPAIAQEVVDDLEPPFTGVLDTGFVYVTRDGDAALDAFRAAAHESPLSRDRGFRNARGRVGGDGILLARIDGQQLEQAPLDNVGSVIIGGQATDDGIRFTLAEERPFVAEPLPEPGELTLAEELAAHAHGVFGVRDPAAALRALLPFIPQGELAAATSRIGLDLEEDLFSWLNGEAAVRVTNFGDGEHHASVVIEASDEQAMRNLIGTVRGFLAFAPPDGVRIEGDDPDRFTVHVGRFDAEVRLEGARLSVEIASRGATTENEDAPAIAGLPDGPVSFAGVVDVAVLIEEAGAGRLFGDAGPFGRYGRFVERIGFEATRDDSGPLLSVTLFLGDHR